MVKKRYNQIMGNKGQNGKKRYNQIMGNKGQMVVKWSRNGHKWW